MKKINFVLIFFGVCIVFSCNNNNKQASQQPVGESKTKIKLTCPNTAYSIPTIIAIEKGFFAENNLDVNVNYVKTGKIAMDDLVGGNANFANIVETNVAFAGFNNPDIQVVCNIEKVYDASIVARKDKKINNPTDLKGKKLGIMLATTSQVFADKFLDKYNIPKSSVQMVNLLPPAMQSAIIEGSGVDAISVWQPYVYNVQKALGNNAITFIEKDIYTGYMNLAGNKTFMQQHPDAVEGLLKGYIKAEQFLASNKEESIQILSKVLALDKQVLESIWNEYEFKISLEKELLTATSSEGKWIIEGQKEFAGKAFPDYSKFFDSSYLNKIAPERVKW